MNQTRSDGAATLTAGYSRKSELVNQLVANEGLCWPACRKVFMQWQMSKSCGIKTLCLVLSPFL